MDLLSAEKSTAEDWVVASFHTVPADELIEELPNPSNRKATLQRHYLGVASLGVQTVFETQNMKLHYDRETDTLLIALTSQQVDETEEIRPGVLVDWDEHRPQ
jgi:nucleoid-associated protein YejK